MFSYIRRLGSIFRVQNIFGLSEKCFFFFFFFFFGGGGVEEFMDIIFLGGWGGGVITKLNYI